MFKRFAGRFEAKAQAHIDGLPLVGETIALPDGTHIQKPNPALIAALRARDSRLRYYPLDEEPTRGQTGRFVFYRGTDGLSEQIIRDFPWGPKGLAMRGLTLSLRGRFPHYSLEEATHDIRHWSMPVDPIDHLEMSDVATVLKTGTDRNGFLGHTGGMSGSDNAPELNPRSHEWMYQHWENESAQCVEDGHPQDAARLFPSLLLYDAEAIKVRDPEDYSIRPEALLAVYVMDRVIERHHSFANVLLAPEG